MNNHFLFHLPNDVQQLMQLAEEIRQLDAYRILSAKNRYILDLALEEMATNIIKYGYDAPGERTIEIKISFDETGQVLELCDDGKPFNPLECGSEENLEDVEDRPIGGVGIYLIRTMVRSMEYRRDAERNVLTIRIDRV